MTISSRIPTPQAQRYLQQLSKHWSHKFEVNFSAEQSQIELPLGTVLMNAGDNALIVELRPESEASRDKLQSVLEEHLDRFAHKEGGLAYDWQETPVKTS
jgi:hypothetical protein